MRGEGGRSDTQDPGVMAGGWDDSPWDGGPGGGAGREEGPVFECKLLWEHQRKG